MVKSHSYNNMEQTKQAKHLYRKESSPSSPTSDIGRDTISLQLKLNAENILQGVIFSEIFGKPKGLRIRRNIK